MSNISVVIYGLNEAENFPNTVLEAHNYLKKITSRHELILVNDGSTDKTHEILIQLQSQIPGIKIITHVKPQGIGSCLKDGYAQADGDFITFLPADGQINPEDLSSLSQAMQEGFDVATTYYSRVAFPVLRRIMSKSVRLFVFLLFGYSPRIEGSYMFRRTILKNITLRSNSFTLNFELVIKAYRAGFKFKELPTVSRERLSGHSKVVNLKTIKRVFIELINLRLNFS